MCYYCLTTSVLSVLGLERLLQHYHAVIEYSAESASSRRFSRPSIVVPCPSNARYAGRSSIILVIPTVTSQLLRFFHTGSTVVVRNHLAHPQLRKVSGLPRQKTCHRSRTLRVHPWPKEMDCHPSSPPNLCIQCWFYPTKVGLTKSTAFAETITANPECQPSQNIHVGRHNRSSYAVDNI